MDWPTAFTSVGTLFGFALIFWVVEGCPKPSRRNPAPRRAVPPPSPTWSSSEVKITAPEGTDPKVFADAVERVLKEQGDRLKKS